MTKPKVMTLARMRGWQTSTLLEHWEKLQKGLFRLKATHQLESVREQAEYRQILQKVLTERGMLPKEKG